MLADIGHHPGRPVFESSLSTVHTHKSSNIVIYVFVWHSAVRLVFYYYCIEYFMCIAASRSIVRPQCNHGPAPPPRPGYHQLAAAVQMNVFNDSHYIQLAFCKLKLNGFLGRKFAFMMHDPDSRACDIVQPV